MEVIPARWVGPSQRSEKGPMARMSFPTAEGRYILFIHRAQNPALLTPCRRSTSVRCWIRSVYDECVPQWAPQWHLSWISAYPWTSPWSSARRTGPYSRAFTKSWLIRSPHVTPATGVKSISIQPLLYGGISFLAVVRVRGMVIFYGGASIRPQRVDN